ncbi:uncharacterized protein LOC127799264 isoform X2 [Diospyros lotus]|uniref:uncharacterized protein LOC127799264 isoform X2 n=1 Tax=Diospyros lotus TaxID=55363 RepID=UPI00224D8864|nr:uncharacterized protein LOC127799264 isoform X2 [Diospyros lotus]
METAANTSQFKIILGSSSVHRQKVLSEMGYNFTVMTADIDERSIRKEKPEELVVALAEAKNFSTVCQFGYKVGSHPTVWDFYQAEAIIPKLPIGHFQKDAEASVLVTCDQGTIREKPSSKEEARQFIKDYSGGSAATVSSVLVTNLRTGFRKGDLDKVEIYFHAIPDQVIDNLIEEEMILNVAGGLITEHPLMLPYIKQVVGTMDSVMGLPKALTERLIVEAL